MVKPQTFRVTTSPGSAVSPVYEVSVVEMLPSAALLSAEPELVEESPFPPQAVRVPVTISAASRAAAAFFHDFVTFICSFRPSFVEVVTIL